MALSPEIQKLIDDTNAQIKRTKEAVSRMEKQGTLVEEGVKKMERDMEFMLNLAGKSLAEDAKAEAARVDRLTRILDVDDRIGKQDEEFDEPRYPTK